MVAKYPLLHDPPHFIPLRCHHGVGGVAEGGGADGGAVRVPVAGGGGGYIGNWRRRFGGGSGAVEGQLVQHGVLPITRVRGWGDRMEAHMDRAWLMMRSHAQGETRVHSGDLGRVEVGGNNNNGGDDDARSRSTVGSKASRGKGRPRKSQRTGPPLPSVPAVPPPPPPKWQIGCSSSKPSPNGNSELWWLRGRFCS